MNQKNLPTNWIYASFEKFCNIIMGQSPPSSTYNREGIGLPFFQGKAEFTELHPITKKWCSQPKKIAPKQSLLVSVRAPVGSVNIANKECCIGRGLASIEYKFCYKFPYYFIKFVESDLDSLGTGSTFSAISKKILSEYLVPLPPLNEQHRIVEKIEELFTKLDAAVKELRNVKTQLKRYRQSVLKSAFEGKLSEEWRNKNNVSKWKILAMGTKLLFRGSGSTPKGGRNVYLKNGIMFLRSQNVYPNKLVLENVVFISSKINNQMKRSSVKQGDVLLNITGASIGRAAYVPMDFNKANVNQHVCILRFDHAKYNSQFILYYLNSPNIQSYINNIQIGATSIAFHK